MSRRAIVTVAAAVCLVAGCRTTATTTSDGVDLSPSATSRHTIAAGNVHRYRVEARRNDLVRIIAVQRGADVRIRVRAADGAVLREVDEPDIRFSTERATFVAPMSGTYQVEIEGVAVATSGTAYELTVTRRAGRNDDHEIVAGETRYYQALALTQERGGGADQIRQAVPLLEEAVKNYRTANDREGEARALWALAAATDDLGDFKKGHPLVLEAIAIQRAGGFEVDLVRSFQELTWASVNLYGQKSAIESSREAIGLAVKHGLRDSEADLRNTLGFALRDLGDIEAARDELQKAAALFADVGDVIGEGRTRLNLSGVVSQLNDVKGAIALMERAVELYRAGKSVEDEAAAILSLGHVYSRQGDLDRAIEFYERVRSIGERQQQPGLIAQALTSLAIAYGNKSDFTRALEMGEAARKANPNPDDPEWNGAAAQSGGRAYYHLGRFKDALDQFERARTLFGAMDSRQRLGRLNLFIGQVYEDLGEAAKARAWYATVLDAPPLEAVAMDRLDALIRLGALDLGAGDLSSARTRLDRARSLAAQTGQAVSEGDALIVLGDLELQAGNTRLALDHFTTARDRYAPGGIRTRLAITTLRLGSATEQTTNSETARRLYLDAVQLAREARTPVVEGLALSRLMALNAVARPAVAVFYGKQAINVYQQLRGNIATLERETQRRFVQTKADSYRTLAEILIALGRLDEARQVLDLLKEEEFFEFVRRDQAQSASQMAQVTLTPEESGWERRYREIGDRLTAIGLERSVLARKNLRTAAEDQRLAALDADLLVAGRAFQAFLDRLAADLQPVAGATRVQGVRDAQGLMDTLRELGPGVVALYTIVGADKYHVILITPDVQTSAEYAISSADLHARIFNLRAAVEDPRRDPRPAAQELYAVLVGPIERALAGAKARTLMWSLDGALRYVPLAALHDGRQFLVERYRNVMITPVSNDRLKDQPAPRWSALGLVVSKAHESFPPLPGAVREIQQIIRAGTGRADAGVLEGKVIADEAFTEEAMTTELRRRYPVVHIASHFAFQPGNESASFLLLGDGKRLSLADLKSFQNLFAGVDLLTLSACNTANGSAGADGREVEGFGVIAQRQGAKAVLATLWPVSDASTPLLMREMYERRARTSGLPKIEALRQAQIAMLRGTRAGAGGRRGLGLGAIDPPESRYRHPYYWAPFVLIGNWR